MPWPETWAARLVRLYYTLRISFNSHANEKDTQGNKRLAGLLIRLLRPSRTTYDLAYAN
jgi:hypothetical protein